MPSSLPQELLAVATAAAAAAARIIQSEAGRAHRDVSTKSSPTDLVSAVDRAAEHCVVAVLSECRPDDAILAEEGTSREGTSGVRWVIDPLDGTTNFLFGVPAYAVSVAAEVDGRATVGVVVDPSRDETWRAVRGQGASLNGRALRLPATIPPLETALVATGFSYLPERRAHQARVLAHLLPRVRDIRRFGAAALDLCWVGAGRVSAFYELGLQPWDLAAGVLIAEEAGAEAATLTDGTTVVTAPGLMEPLRRLIEDGATAGLVS
ncbi:MAG: inositol monophosphatase [Actinomycetota bacterium]|nr:inositol monophosphatase [Actinomycetota bacterium]MDQ6946993.1 inositol monophosphatase [Actinomycetota bacterium]